MGKKSKCASLDLFALYPCEVELVFHKSIRSRSDLNWGEKSFLAEVISIDRITNGKCYYRARELARRFFVSNVTIHKWTKKLAELGFIEITTDMDGLEARRIIKPVEPRKIA